MRVHFFHRLVWDTVIILEEVNLPPIQYSGALAYTEWEAPRHRLVRQGGGEEAQTSGGGRAAGKFGEGLSGLWGTPRDNHFVQVPGKGYYVGGRQLAGSGGQLKKGSEELDVDDKNPGPGEGRPKVI